jgi:hypothetical protein
VPVILSPVCCFACWSGLRHEVEPVGSASACQVPLPPSLPASTAVQLDPCPWNIARHVRRCDVLGDFRIETFHTETSDTCDTSEALKTCTMQSHGSHSWLATRPRPALAAPQAPPPPAAQAAPGPAAHAVRVGGGALGSGGAQQGGGVTYTV